MPHYHGFRCQLPPPDDRPNPDTMACLGRWNMHLPLQHPLWQWYTLAVCHLRDCAGITPAKRTSPDVTHALVVFANDPQHNEAVSRGAAAPLEPLNVSIQFQANDSQAVRLCEHLFEKCLRGELIAEPSGIIGAREMWQAAVDQFLAGGGE